MTINLSIVRTTALLFLASPWVACSVQGVGGGSGGASGSGGMGGSGGQSASGGSPASGGTTSSGGSSATGGATSSGGAGSGGKTGSGGTTSSGGTSALGGSASSGGSGSGGANTSGGTTASGGTTGSGASRGTGGLTGSGGGPGSGGSAVSGGTTGSGGTLATGGATGTGGTTATGGTTVSLDCTDASTTALSFTKQYENGSIALTGSTKTYYTMTNWWHKFSGQTVKLNGLSMTVGNTQNASVPSTDGNPMGFPTIFIGSYQAHTTVGSNLPKQVSAIKSVPTIFSTNASTLDTSNMNAAYDVWFTATSATLGTTSSNPGKGGAYLMVWLYKPSARQPRGGSGAATGASPNFPTKTVTGIPGTWDVWVDSSTDPPCISYVSSTPLDALSFDLNNFIQDAVTQKYGITASMYLSLVFAGFEIWSGGDGAQTKQFCAAVN